MAQVPDMEMLTAAMGHETVQRDLRGGFVLPGPINAPVHVTAITADLGLLGMTSPFYIAAHGVRLPSEVGVKRASSGPSR
jgi:hypothetical protein